MHAKLPDWMFAALAIGGWELCNVLHSRWHWVWTRNVGYAIVGLCVIVLAIRYVLRWFARRRHLDVEDPDAWKQY